MLDERGTGTLDAVPAALDWITNYEDGLVDVVCLNIGYDYPSLTEHLIRSGQTVQVATGTVLPKFLQAVRTIESVILAARTRNNGALIFAPGGNEGRSSDSRHAVTSPTAVANGVLSVGAIDEGPNGYTVPDYSLAGVTLSAPGTHVLCADPKGTGLTKRSGTSSACALTAGTAALWWQFVRQQNRGYAVTADMVWESMKAAVTTDGFKAGVTEDDRGLGLVQAPSLT